MESNTPPPATTPPPLPSPPPIIVPPAPTPPRKSRAWMIISIVLFLLLAVSVLANLGRLFEPFTHISASHQRSGGVRLDEVMVEDNDGSEKIAVIPIAGIISGDLGGRGGYSLVDVVKAQLDRAEEDKKVKAVILKVDSPGGEVLASDDICAATALVSRPISPIRVSAVCARSIRTLTLVMVSL